jgi:two-component system NtrC family response regulator
MAGNAPRDEADIGGLDAEHFPLLRTYRAQELARLDRRYLVELLKISGGRLDRALSLSGLSRARFYALLQQHGLSRSGRGGQDGTSGSRDRER